MHTINLEKFVRGRGHLKLTVSVHPSYFADKINSGSAIPPRKASSCFAPRLNFRRLNLVRGRGIAPPRLSAQEPQSCVATITPPAHLLSHYARLKKFFKESPARALRGRGFRFYYFFSSAFASGAFSAGASGISSVRMALAFRISRRISLAAFSRIW